MNENTVDSILKKLEQMARSRSPIDPALWVNGAMKLNALQGEEDDKLILMEHKCAEQRQVHIETGDNASKAKMKVEASQEFVEARRQRAKIERIKETIRLAKLRARMASDEKRSGL